MSYQLKTTFLNLPFQVRKQQILIYPPFKLSSTRERFFLKLAWYLTPCLNHISSIQIDSAKIRQTQSGVNFDSKVTHALPEIQKLLSSEDWKANQGRFSADITIVWDNRKLRGFKRKNRQTLVFDVDDRRQRFSASNFIRAANQIKYGTPQISESHLTPKFLDFLSSLRGSRVLLLGTGPNLEQAYEFQDKPALTIACNSIVKDLRALSHFRPKVIVAADPVFHVGASAYAAAFRRDLNRFLTNNPDCFFVAPTQHRVLYEFLVDRHLRAQINYLAVSKIQAPNLNILESATVRATENILTLLMIPIAATVAREILFAGFDGNHRSPLTYFWRHNPNAQYHKLMKSAKKVDPVFFKRSFVDYYKSHQCELSSYIRSVREKGIAFKTITDTYINCLKEFR